MLPQESPFTSNADIKELPHALDGSFTWLHATPLHTEDVIGKRSGDLLPSQIESAIASAAENGIKLPAEFVSFIQTPSLHDHLRSATACYLDVAENLLPFANGYLLRFLNDQQGCAFWYIYLNSDATDHCVVSSYEYFDADEMDYEIEDLKESDFYIWAVSFESFWSRFWLENEILFAQNDSTPLPDVDLRFLELYGQ